MTVNKIALLANTGKPDVRKVFEEMKNYFEGLGIDVCTVELDSSIKDFDIKPIDVDLAVTVGGDGTVLSCARIFRDSDVPLFAVNMGTFGYMTEISISDYKDVFRDFMEGKCFSVKRMRLGCRVERNGNTAFESSALNEITVSSASVAKMAKFSLYINNVLAANLKGDGVIVATPTGSTAYNLSAGGPILDANLSSMIINPICTFTMGVRPLVISSDSEVQIAIPEQECKTVLTCDGHEEFELQCEDRIIVYKSNRSTLFVENKRRNFIEILRNKLGWAGGFNA